MSNFDFLKQYDKSAFKWAKEMERTLYTEHLSTLAFGGRFLEAIRNALYKFHYKDLYKNSVNLINDTSEVEFKKEDLSKHISNLAHKNLIKHSFSYKIINAYNTRHNLHLNNDVEDSEADEKAAFKLYEQVYEIALLFCEHIDSEFVVLDYEFKLPNKNMGDSEVPDVKIARIFDKCIICGKPNTISNHNFCPECKRKIRIANDLEDLLEILEYNFFTKKFLKKNSYDKFEIDYIIHFLREFDLIIRKGKDRNNEDEYFLKDRNELYDFIEETQAYEDIEKVLLAFYNNLIPADKLDYSDGSPYKLGEEGEFYKEFYNLIVDKKVKHFLTLKTKNRFVTIDDANLTLIEISNWYLRVLDEIKQVNYKKGCDISFTKMSKLLMSKWINYRKQGYTKVEIMDKLKINDKIISFWFDNSIKVVSNYKFIKEFIEDNKVIVMKLFVDAIAEGKSKKEAMKIVDINEQFVNKYFNLLDSDNVIRKFKILKQLKNKGQFERFKELYFDNKIKEILDNLNGNTLDYALTKAELPLEEFNEWYEKGRLEFISYNRQSTEYEKGRFVSDGKNEFTQFYTDVTRIFLDNWLTKRREGIKKEQACIDIGVDPKYLKNWFRFKEFKFRESYFGEFEECDNELFNEFYLKHDEIILDLIKEAIEKGDNKEKIAKYVDVDLDLIDYIYKLGQEGNKKYESFVDNLEGKYIDHRLKEFLKVFDRYDNYEKAIKSSELSEDIINKICNLAINGNEEYKEFYEEFLQLKIRVYCYLLIKNKKQKQALRRANLTKEELIEFENEINTLDLVLKMNIIIRDSIHGKKMDKVARNLSLTINKIYDWYFKGRDLITVDEYLDIDEINELEDSNFLNHIIKSEDYKFNNHNSLDKIYKFFYNLFNEAHVNRKSEIISEHIESDTKFLNFLLKKINVTKQEFKIWDELGLIVRSYDDSDDEDTEDMVIVEDNSSIRNISNNN